MFLYDGQFGLNLSLATWTCQSVVSAPIDATRIPFNEQKNYREFLKEGFLLQWGPSNCISCCGLYNKKFVCFCHDGRHRLCCNDDGKPNDHPCALQISSLVPFNSSLPI
uniref:Wall-associated receptor kinase C-terminal domain-containing protein n=1 Tax=Nelumbo nucifera TaxID=4432 RepID=A0A822YK36_NELNU|nr:TPA_asm: hypothetical protein HUJ06_031196 [Nelumbo nucifera]